MTAAYYNISCEYYRTGYLDILLICSLDISVEVYTLSLKERTKLRGLLEVMSSLPQFCYHHGTCLVDVSCRIVPS
jgi:hypothetical protein